MKAAIKSILKGVERVTDICTEILTYDPIKNGCWSHRDNRKNLRRWCTDLRRFTKKIKTANRKYEEEVLKLKNNLDSSILQGEVYDFFIEVTTSLVLYVKKLTRSVKPFLVRIRDGKSHAIVTGVHSQRTDLLKSMKVFKTSIMQVMKTFFRIIDRTKELELCVYNNRVGTGCKRAPSALELENTPTIVSGPPQLYQISELYRYNF